MRYKIRGMRPKALREESTGPKLSVIIKGNLNFKINKLKVNYSKERFWNDRP